MEIKIPEIGESILEALVANWFKEDGDAVAKDDIICELETDKVNVELTAEASGILSIVIPQGQTVPIGTVIATLAEGDVEVPAPLPAAEEKTETGATPAATDTAAQKQESQPPANPAARQQAEERGIDLQKVTGSGRDGRVILDDVLAHDKAAASQAEPKESESSRVTAKADGDDRPITRQAMTPIRQRIAARLLQARQETAMLTTFNEADMSWVKKIRKRHQEQFTKKHSIKLGMMSFFVKACIEALKEFPAVNASIDGSDIVYHHYYDIGIAPKSSNRLPISPPRPTPAN
jgi:2-oxoglutarate dehydrogenase E2 component (dihydrolipoamide succinyltransferase)